MRSLTVTTNPVQQTYGGGDQLNVRDLKNMHDTTTQNFQAIEQAINRLEYTAGVLTSKLAACHEFIEWVQKYRPETTEAYKAHNTVLHAFDKAAGHDGEAMAETSA
jgi:hypothetical protein